MSATGTAPQHVEVRNRFDGSWSRGYTIAEVILTEDTPQYRLRRFADGTMVPGTFRPEELRSVADSFVVDWEMALAD
ncbi:MAG TPA: hypothetical protein VFP54_00290 [Acidimicrobiales bacterium]|nr:hypothetical protein [Acidimicrobiales bacterium]